MSPTMVDLHHAGGHTQKLLSPVSVRSRQNLPGIASSSLGHMRTYECAVENEEEGAECVAEGEVDAFDVGFCQLYG